MSIQIVNLPNHLKIVVDNEPTVIAKIGTTIKAIPSSNQGISIFHYGELIFNFNTISQITAPTFTDETDLINQLTVWLQADNTNTVVTTLEEIRDSNDNIEIYAENIDLNTDNLENIISTGNTLLSSISGKLGIIQSNQIKDFGIRVDGVQRGSSKQLLEFSYGDSDIALDVNTAGTGTATINTNVLDLTVTSGQFVVGQTRCKANYVKGNPQLIELTLQNGQVEANTTKEIGYYSDSVVSPFSGSVDGIRLYNDATQWNLQFYRNSTLVLNVPASSWLNTDAYNYENFTVFAIDFLYLGGAGCRLFRVTNGVLELMYSLVYPGNYKNTFIGKPNHGIRFALRSTTGSGTFTPICGRVSTEGEVNEGIGKTRPIINGNTAVSFSTIGTTYAVLGVRLKQANLNDVIKIINSSVFITSNDQARVSLVLNPTVSGTFTYSDVSNTPLQRAIGAGGTTNVVTGGTELPSTFAQQYQNANIIDNNILLQLGSKVDGTADTLVLCLTPITNTVSALGIINYKKF